MVVSNSMSESCRCNELEERSMKAEMRCAELEFKLQKKDEQCEVLEAKLKALEDEVEVLRVSSEELKEKKEVGNVKERGVEAIIDLTLDDNDEAAQLKTVFWNVRRKGLKMRLRYGTTGTWNHL